MICYICKLFVNDFQKLKFNFKIIHMLKPNKFANLQSQSFQSLAFFQRHVERKDLTYYPQDDPQPIQIVKY